MALSEALDAGLARPQDRMATGKNGRVGVIVLNWNGRDDTLECLESLMQVDYPDFEILVVDNGSSDGSVAAIANRFPAIRIVETGSNLGFAGGNNIGIRAALQRGAEYVFLLNNDTVVDPGVLRNLVAAAETTHEGGIFGAKIYYYRDPNRVWYAGGARADESAHFLHVGQHEIDDGVRYSTMSETDYACGCALFARADVLREVGLLDERFFLTYEETDLCFRARKAGYRSYMVPAAKVWHKVSTSMGGEGSILFNYFIARNRLLWAEKNEPLRRLVVVYGRILKEITWSFLSPRLAPQGATGSRASWINRYRRALADRCKDPLRRVRLRALGDYLFRRFGGCPESVRAWVARSKNREHVA